MTHAKISEYRESPQAATLKAKEVMQTMGYSIIDDQRCAKNGNTHAYAIIIEETNNKWAHRKYSWSLAIKNSN